MDYAERMQKDQLKYLQGRVWIWIVLSCVVFFDAVFLVPNYIGAQKKQRSAMIKGNMRTVQIAAESFATDTGGEYPWTLDGIRPYLPGGGNQQCGPPGTQPTNPVTGDSDSIFVTDALSTPEKIRAIENSGRNALHLIPGAKPGQIIYSRAKDGSGYVLTYVEEDGRLYGAAFGHILMF